MFKKILIANRGEIALRIVKACQELGIKTVAIHSEVDKKSMHVMLADESVCVGSAKSSDSYLNMASIISAALVTGSDAIHPGVGFLSENEKFARMVNEHRISFIGPSPEHIKVMGNKITAKAMAKQLNIPITEGSKDTVETIDEAKRIVDKLGAPVIIKARSGGGGKGMQVVYNDQDLKDNFKIAKKEALMNFGDDGVYIEKFLDAPKHIEIQVLCDHYGNVLTLGERDCSLQRRFQKVFEETPSPAISNSEREYISNIVSKASKKIGYKGVGTFEFLYQSGKFYFMEMNTRLQVEHPITEMVTGIDLVKNQIKIAYGTKLEYKQSDIKFNGHAIECRINAENPETFAASPGIIDKYHPPSGLGIRTESHIYSGYQIPVFYDSLISKLIVHDKSREECIKKTQRALHEYVITGIDHLIPMFNKILNDNDVINGDYHINHLKNII